VQAWRLFTPFPGTTTPDLTQKHHCPVGTPPAPPSTAFGRKPEGLTFQPPASAPESAPESIAVAPPAGLDALGQALATVVQPYLDAHTVDRDEVAQIVAEQLALAREEWEAYAGTPRPMTIQIERSLPTGEVITEDGGLAHYLLPKALRILRTRDANGFPLALNMYGKPGAAKSYTAKQLAKILGVKFYAVSVCKADLPSKLFGFVDANGVFRSPTFREAWEHGGVFLIDEADNSSATILIALNLALAGDEAAFPDGMVKRHPEFYCVAAMNTTGRGGDAAHPDRAAIDSATIDRFIYLPWQYDEAIELALAAKTNKRAGAWVKWVQAVRVHCEANQDRLVVSPRASMSGAALLVDLPSDWTIEEVADMVLFKGINRDVRSRVLSACPLPVAV
jgi:hypothetical protein